MEIFELLMVVMFGVSWPISIIKSWRSKKTGGKSVVFLFCIMIGYISGIVYKISTGFNYVSYMYIVNLCMVCVDTLLYFRNRKLECKK